MTSSGFELEAEMIAEMMELRVTQVYSLVWNFPLRFAYWSIISWHVKETVIDVT